MCWGELLFMWGKKGELISFRPSDNYRAQLLWRGNETISIKQLSIGGGEIIVLSPRYLLDVVHSNLLPLCCTTIGYYKIWELCAVLFAGVVNIISRWMGNAHPYVNVTAINLLLLNFNEVFNPQGNVVLRK